MPFVPNNPVGNTSMSQSTVLVDAGVSIGVDFGYTTQYVSEFINIEGLPNIALSAQGSADGNAPDYPDANVGSLLITIISAYGNSGVFEAGNAPTEQVVAEFTVAQTSNQVYVSPPLYEKLFVPAPLIRFEVSFFPNESSVAGNFGKCYVRIVASS